jgi:hypothetical protein
MFWLEAADCLYSSLQGTGVCGEAIRPLSPLRSSAAHEAVRVIKVPFSSLAVKGICFVRIASGPAMALRNKG